MAQVDLHLHAGYDPEATHRLSDALSCAVRLVLPVRPDDVTVKIFTPAQTNDPGGNTPLPVRADPEELVRGFLQSLAARDLTRAETYLADGVSMTFPGTRPMHSLTDLMDWAAPRYRRVEKTYEGFDTLQSSGAAAVVYCRGTLSGVWPDGSRFEGIRFIDRFEITRDLISRQEVWNDMAEVRAQA
ncbi:MAG: tautomerase [Pseudomonadota bacterium]